MNRRTFFVAVAGSIATFAATKAVAGDLDRKRGLRISADEGDTGYAAWMALPRQNGIVTGLRTFLNGVEQRHVVTADEDEGFVYRAVAHPEDGGIQIDPNVPDTIWMETVYGNVRIVLPS